MNSFEKWWKDIGWPDYENRDLAVKAYLAGMEECERISMRLAEEASLVNAHFTAIGQEEVAEEIRKAIEEVRGE